MWQIIVKNAAGEVCARVDLAGGELTIGRGRDCGIVLDSKLASRRHASLRLDGERLLFKDEGSANGSEIDGVPVKAPVNVSEASRIEIAEFQIELRRTAPAAKKPAVTTPPPPAPPEIAGFSFKPPPPVVKAEEPPAETFSDSMASLLDQQMRGVQKQREEYEHKQRRERERFEQEWRDTVTAARELRGRFGKHPKLLYFVIARDDSEIAVKVAEKSKRGHCNLTLSRRHPEKDVEMEGRCWFAESDMEPESFREPRDGLAELVRVLAVMLA